VALLFGAAACVAAVEGAEHRPYSTPKYGADRFVQARGYTLHYVEAGAGEPILLIPGAFTTYRAWNRVLAGLSLHARVLAVDDGVQLLEEPDGVEVLPAAVAVGHPLTLVA